MSRVVEIATLPPAQQAAGMDPKRPSLSLSLEYATEPDLARCARALLLLLASPSEALAEEQSQPRDSAA